MIALWIAAGLLLLPLVAWLYYIAIMGMKRVEDLLHPYVRAFGRFFLLPIGLLLDLAVNLEVCAAFLRLPRDWLLTGTLKRIQNTEPSGSWRETVAVWLCVHLLNQFDPKGKHC